MLSSARRLRHVDNSPLFGSHPNHRTRTPTLESNPTQKNKLSHIHRLPSLITEMCRERVSIPQPPDYESGALAFLSNRLPAPLWAIPAPSKLFSRRIKNVFNVASRISSICGFVRSPAMALTSKWPVLHYSVTWHTPD